MTKRKLTKSEIRDILDFIEPNPNIPEETAQSLTKETVKLLKVQLKTVEIYPKMIPQLKAEIRKSFFTSQVPAGECVGIVTAQSIGEKQTQSNLNTFHKAGSADKQPTVSKFSELLNATNKPKAPSYWIYFKEGNSTIPELRETIGNTLIHNTMKKLTKSFTVHIDKEPEPWYEAFSILYGEKEERYTDCITIKVNMDILYEYKFTLESIADVIASEYTDLYCIFSPDCYGQLDIFVDTANIELSEEKLVFVTQDNAREIYLEEVVQPILDNITVCGIQGINNMFFVQSGDGWIIETENSRDKQPEVIKFKNVKEKPADSVRKFKQVLAHPKIDMTRTVSNNVWDIYHTLGIEATRQYMIDQFSEIMSGINKCHVMLLVDKMTYSGTIASISRYTMRSDDGGVLSKASFEETLDNFIKAGVHGQEEPTKGVSASIICGKRAPIGTGLCELEMDMEKILN
jgi:DNA-directed RNA polymerase beta' subunit